MWQDIYSKRDKWNILSTSSSEKWDYTFSRDKVQALFVYAYLIR